MLLALFCRSLQAEDFSKFIVRFFCEQQSQTKHVSFPIKQDGRVVSKQGDYKNIRTEKNGCIAFVCSDSLNGVALNGNSVVLNHYDLQKKKSEVCKFKKVNSGWKLFESSISSWNTENEDFLDFISVYSRNKEFQMKRTIFPVPQLTISRGKEKARNLVMPREWVYIDFANVCPDVAFIDNNPGARNRRLYVYRGCKLSQVFNFIQINKRWMLIEIENHSN